MAYFTSWSAGLALWLYTVIAMRQGGGFCTAIASIVSALIAILAMTVFLVRGDMIGLCAVMGLVVAAFVAALAGGDSADLFFS